MKLGYANVDVMLASITWRQFEEWVVYSGLDPFAEDRADLRAAQIVTALANINRDRKKRRRPYTIADFVLTFGDSKRSAAVAGKSWQQLKAIGKSIAESFNAVKRTSPGTPPVRRRRRT